MILRRAAHYVFVFFAVIILGFLVRPDYYVIKPGTAEELCRLIQIEGQQPEGPGQQPEGPGQQPAEQEQPTQPGKFYMLTVAQYSANLWSLLYGYLHPSFDVRSISQSIPPQMTREEYNELMQSWMQDSKNLAGVIAFRRAGYEVPITSDGVEIVELLPGSPAEGILQPGDIVTAIEGEKIYLAEEVVAFIKQKRVGERIMVGFQRKGEDKEAGISTATHVDDPQLAALRLYVRTLNWKPCFPLAYNIETGPVVGPSAGMMFVLEILDRLLPGDLTGGYRIGGTGTITLDEKVGGIGGVKQKVLAAEKAGLDYFLVPAENYEEAQRSAHKIGVIPVNNLEEALGFLETLNVDSGMARLPLASEALRLIIFPRINFASL